MREILNIFNQHLPTPIHQIHETLFEEKEVQLFLKRDDLIHPEVSGNKWRKLKYNLQEAQRKNLDTILTFGGAYSNHIAATAAACKMAGMKSIGIIRGEELNEQDNPTLRKAIEDGMLLHFISREEYRRKNESVFIEKLHQRFGDFYLIPEGGANEFGMKGCMEIMQEVQEHFDIVCIACGTGTTLAGIVASLQPNQKALGFPALKGGDFLEKEIFNLMKQSGNSTSQSFQLISKYHFGGYARHTPELLQFIRDFKTSQGIELDFIYTGKMLFCIYEMIKNDFFPRGANILSVHTGGLQGNNSVKSSLPREEIFRDHRHSG